MHINIIKYKILWTLMYVIFHTYSRILMHSGLCVIANWFHCYVKSFLH
jgi:hypothetical protein